MTDSIQTGDFKDSKNIAVGDKAQVNVNEVHHHHPSPPEKPTFPIYQIAHPQNPNFTGREEILQQVENTLAAGQTTVVTQTIAGLGGVGKTQLALAYSYAHLKEYDLIYWLSADSEPGLGEDLMGLARRLKLIPREATDQQAALQVVLLWLGQTNQRWLLVYDNADQIEPGQLAPFLPRSGNGHVLITSRNPNYGGLGKVLELGLFDLDEAVRFLFRRKEAKGKKVKRGGKEWQEAVALAEALGRFPLALEHAAAYVESKGSSYAAYHRLFINRQAELWQRAKRPEQYHATITTTWKLAFVEVKKTPGALDLMNLCCFLYPESISLDLIKQAANIQTPHITSLQTLVEDELSLDDAIEALRRYSLIQKANDVLSLHQLVQLVIRNNLNQASKDLFASLTLSLFITALKEKDATISYSLLHHLKFILTILRSKKVLTDEFLKSSTVAEEFIQHVEDYLEIQGVNLEQIESLHSEFRVLADKLENLNERFSSFPESSFHRLLLSDFQKQYQEIQAGLKKNITNLQNSSVFDIPDGFVKSEHEKTIVELLKAIDVRLRLIETTIYSLDDLAKSLQHIQQDLTINEIDQNLDQLETAQELFNTAILAHHKGDYAELVRLMRQAIVVFEELLGANHPDTIISHKIIAVVEEAFGRSDVK